MTDKPHTIATRIGAYLERQGLLERDVENSYLTAPSTPDEDDPLSHMLGSSITYRLAETQQAAKKHNWIWVRMPLM